LKPSLFFLTLFLGVSVVYAESRTEMAVSEIREDRSLEALLKKRDYSAAKKIAEAILKKDPNHALALEVVQTEFESPNVRPDGMYVSSSFGFRVKKPEGWIVFDRETNGEFFKVLVTSDSMNVACYFSSGIPPVGKIRIELVERPREPLSKEEFAAVVSRTADRLSAAQYKFEGPKEVELNGRSFYRLDSSDPDRDGSGRFSSAVWMFSSGDGIYSVTCVDSTDRMAHDLPVFEGVVASFEGIQ